MLTKGRKTVFLALVLLVIAMALGYRWFGKSGRIEEPKPDQPGGTQKAEVAVYYVKYGANDAYLVREVHTVETGKDPMVAAVEELIRGVPQTTGAFTVLPPNTEVRGIKVENDVATVDFSREVLKANVGAQGEALGIQSVVNTLTEFPGINKVAFTVEGEIDETVKGWWGHVGLYDQPFTRNLSVVWEPAIWVTLPKPDQLVSSPVLVKGTARVFEATVNIRVTDKDGRNIAETFTTATAGAPERGEFETEISFPTPKTKEGYIEVFWYSPKDGSETDKVRVPIKFE